MISKVADRGAPKQLAQPSRKGKKAWRKNVDVAELEAGLEDLRTEIEEGYVISVRFGGGISGLAGCSGE